MRDCFDPQSSICRACVLTDNPDEIVMFHLSHLEVDHGIKVIEDEQGIIKVDPLEFEQKGGYHGR
jgi:hypothetical protein